MSKELVFRIRMNKTERELVNKRAEEAGMKPTAYVRSLVFPKNVATKKQIVATIKHREVLDTLISDFKKLDKKEKAKLTGIVDEVLSKPAKKEKPFVCLLKKQK